MLHAVDLGKLLEEIDKADRPKCLWLSKKDAIKIIKENAKKIKGSSK